MTSVDILFWVVVIVAAALIALLIVSRSAARSRIDPTEVTIDPAVATEVRSLYARDRKVEAIKVLRAATGLGLADAVRIGDKLAASRKPPRAAGAASPASTTSAPDVPNAINSGAIDSGAVGPGDQQKIRALVADDRKIDAIRMVRELTGMGLKEAKRYVESL